MTMRSFNLWVVVKPAEDLPDQWVAHCLDLDVITQGTSFKHAMDMVFEASSMVIAEEIVAGRDPLARRAPDEDWNDLYKIVSEGHQVPFSHLQGGVSREFVKALASQVVLSVQLQPVDHICGIQPSFEVPLTWEKARRELTA
jgi:hypothetical protein